MFSSSTVRTQCSIGVDPTSSEVRGPRPPLVVWLGGQGAAAGAEALPTVGDSPLLDSEDVVTPPAGWSHLGPQLPYALPQVEGKLEHGGCQALVDEIPRQAALWGQEVSPCLTLWTPTQTLPLGAAGGVCSAWHLGWAPTARAAGALETRVV